MSHNLLQRSLALGLAAMLTLATLGGLDRLAQPDPMQQQLAAAGATRAAEHAGGPTAADRT